MKALTICQPYAYMIVCGEKRVENRTWSTNYRGRLYIHAGKSRKWLELVDDPIRAGKQFDFRTGHHLENMAFGAVVAVATLVDCVRMSKGGSISLAATRAYPWLRTHPHSFGPWCWILDKVTAIGPWPWKGAQGLFNIDDAELDAVANRELATP